MVQLLNMARTLPITDDSTHSDQAISDEAPLVSMTVSDRYLCVSFAGLDSVRQMHLRGIFGHLPQCSRSRIATTNPNMP